MENKKKFYATDYTLGTPHFESNSPKKILVLSDIHFQPSVSKELYILILEYARKTNPDFIVMPGDLMETNRFIDMENEKKFFDHFIEALGETSPVLITSGNHDLGNFTPSNFTDRLETSKNPVNIKAMNYLESLNRFNNVYFLNNESVNFDNVTFYGFNPRIGSYLKRNDKKTTDEFIEDYIKSGFKMEKDKYNVLLTHAPLQLTNEEVFNTVSDFNSLTDLAITGHFHDGYLPKILDKKFGNTNVGIFTTPVVAPYPGIPCRGVHDYGRGYLFISQGFRKWTTDLFLMNALEKVSVNDVEDLIIYNSNDKEIEKIEFKPFDEVKIRKRK